MGDPLAQYGTCAHLPAVIPPSCWLGSLSRASCLTLMAVCCDGVGDGDLVNVGGGRHLVHAVGCRGWQGFKASDFKSSLWEGRRVEIEWGSLPCPNLPLLLLIGSRSSPLHLVFLTRI